MLDRGKLFPGYVVREALESPQHYENFLATCEHSGSQWVVIRSLNRELAHTNELRNAFDEACHAQARVQIDGIMPLREIGVSEACGVFAVFPCPNQPLSLLDISALHQNKELKVPPSFYVSILLDAARILDAAHRQSLAHYTLQPDSVLITPQGEVGVAHFIEAAMRRRFKLARHLDEKHSAPEWRRGETPGVYSDVYAVAAQLYQLLTDKFQPDQWEPDWFNIPRILASSDIPVDAVLPLFYFFQRNLAEKPAQRISNYPQLIHALEDLHAVLGPYQDANARKVALMGFFETFPPEGELRSGEDSSINSRLKSEVVSLKSAELTADAPDRTTEPLPSSDIGLVTDVTPVEFHPPATERRRCLSLDLDDSDQRRNFDETVTSPSQDSRDSHFVHRSSNTFRQQSPMMRSSSNSNHLEILAKSRYQVLEKLGSGGTGSVYKVLDTTLSEVVALKVLKQELVSNADWLQRFKSEMRLSRDLDHTYILPAYHLEQLDGIYFFTMKYIEGRNLAQLLHDGPLALPIALRLLVQIGHALTSAHERGITHRDVKPANIMVELDTLHPWLMDFGIASAPDMQLSAPVMNGIGTPYYMAPEQSRGDEITTSADIFSFGVVAYECLTHTLPFTGSTPMAIYNAMLESSFTPILELNPLVPLQVSCMVERCLIPEAVLRPQSMNKVLEAFRNFA